MKLITEYIDEGVTNTLEEGVGGAKQMFIQGPFLQGAVKNRNGRIYPTEILENQVRRFYDKINNSTAMGELNHPQRPNVDPREASHLVTEIRKEGNDFFGKAKVLTHVPIGQIVEGLILDGVRLGVSSRGVGSLKENTAGILEVQNDYFLSTIDVVSDPSGPDCFVNGIMEGTEWIVNNGGFRPEQIEQARKYIDQQVASRSLDEEALLHVWETMIGGLAK